MSGLLIGRKAPSFKSAAVVNGVIDDSFSLDDFLGKYVVFFFYPLDFTFVCPTELHAFQDRLEDFRGKGAEVVACSVDSVYSHLAWLRVPKNRGGIEGVCYPIVSDLDKSISKDFCVLDWGEGVACRGLFLLDKDGVIRHYVVNDPAFGRSVDEAFRMLSALERYDSGGCRGLCPANWSTGDQLMAPSQKGVGEYFGG